MLNRLPKTPILLLLGAVLLFGLYWSTSKSPHIQQDNLEPELAQTMQLSLVSAIQPVSPAEATQSAQASVRIAATEELTLRFEKANSYAVGDEINMAKLHFQDLIRDYPRAVEPYVNLAALYAQESQLDRAQQTLTEGLNANQSYAALFASLQKILGALAANAYKDALQEESGKITTLQLPLLQSVSSGGASSEQLKTLSAQLDQAREAVAEAQKAASMSAVEQQKIIDLRAELNTARQSLQTLESEYQAKLASVQSKLDEQTLAANNLSAANQKQQSEIAAARQLAAAKQEEIDQSVRDAKAKQLALAQAQQAERDSKAQQQALALARQAERDARAREQEERDAIAQQQALALAQQEAQQAKAKKQAEKLRAQAIAHVNRWARAWSNQSVSDYVASYASGYAPEGNGLSHQQWLEQRRVRLTNKSFIEVEVSSFRVAKTAQGFDVTFLQHYRADNINDRIQKRLSFAAPRDGWANAKIIRETIIK